jgi:hypothetical protein
MELEFARTFISLGSLLVAIVALAISFQTRQDPRRLFQVQHTPEMIDSSDLVIVIAEERALEGKWQGRILGH